MSSYENFKELPESDKKSFFEMLIKVVGGIPRVDAETVLPSPSVVPVVSDVPENTLVEDEKKSPMKQKTLDKWLVKSKGNTSVEIAGTSKVQTNLTDDKNKKCEDEVVNITETSDETYSDRVYEKLAKQLHSSINPIVVLERFMMDDKEPLFLGNENSLENPDDIPPTQKSLVSVNADGIALSSDIDPLSVQTTESGPLEVQEYALSNLPSGSYSSKLRCRSKRPRLLSHESIDSSYQRSNKSCDGLHQENSKIDVICRIPEKVAISPKKNNEIQSNIGSTIDFRNCKVRDHLDEIIENVVKNLGSLGNENIIEASQNRADNLPTVKLGINECTLSDESPPQATDSDRTKEIQNNEKQTAKRGNKSKSSKSKDRPSVSDNTKPMLTPVDSETNALEIEHDTPFKGDETLLPEESGGLLQKEKTGSPSKKLPLVETDNHKVMKPCDKDSLSSKTCSKKLSSKKKTPNCLTSNSLTFEEENVDSFVPLKVLDRKCKKSQKQTNTESQLPVSQQKRKRSLDSENCCDPYKKEICTKKSCSGSYHHVDSTISVNDSTDKDDAIFSPRTDITEDVNSNVAQVKKKCKLTENSESSRKKTVPKRSTSTTSNNSDKNRLLSDNSVIETLPDFACNMKNKSENNDHHQISENDCISAEKNKGTVKNANSEISQTEKSSKENKNCLPESEGKVSDKKISKFHGKSIKKDKKVTPIKIKLLKKNIKITISGDSEKKVSLSKKNFIPGGLDTKKKFDILNIESENLNPIIDESLTDVSSPSSNFDSNVINPSQDSDSLSDLHQSEESESQLNLSDLKNLVVTVQENAPCSENPGSVGKSRTSKRKISIQSDSAGKLLNSIALNQEMSEGSKMGDNQKQSSDKDSSSGIPKKKMNSKAKHSVSTKKAKKCRSHKEDTAKTTDTISNGLLDCSIGMTNSSGLSQIHFNYEAYNEVNTLCSSIGLNVDKLFQIPEIVDSIKNSCSEDAFIIRGHKLLSGVIVPSVCKTDDFGGFPTDIK